MTNKDQVMLAEAYFSISNQSVIENTINENTQDFINTLLQDENLKKFMTQMRVNILTGKKSGVSDGEIESTIDQLLSEIKKGLIPTEININPGSVTSDMTYAKRGGYVESFVHGIQPISEAKKKINPWAVEKSIKKKMEAKGKKVSPKKEEEIVKGIKKTAKKSGKKITSDKVKKK